MAVKEPTPPVEESNTPRDSGFHVMHEGKSLGCYLTAEDAEAFADGHPRANGLTVSVEEVKG